MTTASCLAGIVGVVVLLMAKPAAGVGNWQEREGDIRLLTAKEMVGARLPLAPYIEIGAELERGKWVVVVYHADCSLCKESLPRFDRLTSRVAFVEMPPYHGASLLESSNHRLGHLTDKYQWFATTPLVLVVNDGIVERAVEGEEAVDPEKLGLGALMANPAGDVH